MRRHPLKSYRVRNRLTQARLAAMLKVSRSLIAAMETGAKSITPDMALRIEKRLGIPREVSLPTLFKRAAPAAPVEAATS